MKPQFMHWNRFGKRLAFIFCLMLLVSGASAGEFKKGYIPPILQNNYHQLTGAALRSEYLKRLSAFPSKHLNVQYRILGRTVEHRPIDALLIRPRKNRKPDSQEKLRVLLMAAQHGSEISGDEALLVLAGNWIAGQREFEWMKNMEILIVPAVNPDGIERKKRVNARGVNLSTDYGLLASPESSSIHAALLQFKPHVLLDIHESAVWKKKSLGAEGWLTDMEAQFEYPTNPNVDPDLQAFCANVMVPQILNAIQSRGLRAERYIGEITRTDQEITHGGLSAHNLRNKAALLGTASFLLENRLDVSTETYPTPRNIKERVRKQMLCITTFLITCHGHLDRLIMYSKNARTACRTDQTVWLQPAYVQNLASPVIEIPLRRTDNGKRVMHRFIYRKDISNGPASHMPERYCFLSHTDFFKSWLQKQGIPWTRCHSKRNPVCIEARVSDENGWLLPLYLESESASSILKRLPFDPDQVRIERK